jgi:hypothetical protein
LSEPRDWISCCSALSLWVLHLLCASCIRFIWSYNEGMSWLSWLRQPWGPRGIKNPPIQDCAILDYEDLHQLQQ